MIEAQVASDISSMLHMLWAYCQVNTAVLEVVLIDWMDNL